MKRPVFTYHPNAYALSFESVQGCCDGCGQPRSLRYRGPFYSRQRPAYLCPWCVADGSASARFEGEFTGWSDVEGISPDPADPPPTLVREQVLEVCERTPGYLSWQQSVWLSHCNRPCAFLGYAGSGDLLPILDEVRADVVAVNPRDADWLLAHLSRDGGMVGCLFRCLDCGQHRLHVDLG